MAAWISLVPVPCHGHFALTMAPAPEIKALHRTCCVGMRPKPKNSNANTNCIGGAIYADLGIQLMPEIAQIKPQIDEITILSYALQAGDSTQPEHPQHSSAIPCRAISEMDTVFC
jgi:hypothetical protein